MPRAREDERSTAGIMIYAGSFHPRRPLFFMSLFPLHALRDGHLRLLPLISAAADVERASSCLSVLWLRFS